jgi:hypothetical protein
LNQLDDVWMPLTIDQWPVGESSGFSWQLRLVLVLDGLDDAKLPRPAFTLNEFNLTLARIKRLHDAERILQLHTPGGREWQRVDVVSAWHVGSGVGSTVVGEKMISQLRTNQ